jgi:hypothetical protein
MSDGSLAVGGGTAVFNAIGAAGASPRGSVSLTIVRQ